MAYCGPHGIPYTEFLQWDDLSRDAALAWKADHDQRCSSCGTHRDQWWVYDSDGQPIIVDGYPKVDLTRWTIDTAYCPGCHLLSLHREQHRDDDTTAWQHPHFTERASH